MFMGKYRLDLDPATDFGQMNGYYNNEHLIVQNGDSKLFTVYSNGHYSYKNLWRVVEEDISEEVREILMSKIPPCKTNDGKLKL